MAAHMQGTHGKQLGSSQRKQRNERATANPAVIRLAPIGIVRITDRRITIANKAAETVFGYPRRKLLNRDIRTILADRAISEALARLAPADKLHDRACRILRKDGSLKHTLLDAAATDCCTWLFFRDVTRIHELERELLMAPELEKQRLGRDIHDELCQQLTGIEFLAESLALRLAPCLSQEAARAREIARIANRTSANVRMLIQGLSPLAATRSSLASGLRVLARQTSKVFGIRCFFKSSGDVDVAEEAAGLQLYRIAEEAIANAIRHGRANKISVRLSASHTYLSLIVSDNGCGVIGQTLAGRGHGLSNMQHRAKVIGASVSVRPAHGCGTLVCCRLPLKRPDSRLIPV